MKQAIFEIEENKQLTETVFQMRLLGDTSDIVRPGQFVNIQVGGFYLRRPISVCDCTEGALTLIYKVVGGGTAALSAMTPGDKLDLLTGLGNGYDTQPSGSSPLLIGGGVGIPPLYLLCKTLLGQGKNPCVILGFNTKDECFLYDEFCALGVQTIVTTVDGTFGTKGFVTDAMAGLSYTYFYTCGPEAMLKAVDKAAAGDGQFSFEERMGCGFGACMGCSCKTKYGTKRICKEGPVLEREEIVW